MPYTSLGVLTLVLRLVGKNSPTAYLVHFHFHFISLKRELTDATYTASKM